jgi:glycosyltransferase involved in cell wall biosynthesis
MHVGLITRGDLAYTLDLANGLHEAGMSITLYLPHAHTVREVGSLDRPAERLYEVGLVPRDCRVRLIRLPRMRDPRSIAVFYRLSQTICDDGVDLAHLLVGPDELWFAVLPFLLRDVPVISTMIVPKPNIGCGFAFWIVWAIQKLLAYSSDIVIVNGADQVSLVQKLYRIPLNRLAYIPLSPRTTAITWSTKMVREEPGTILFFGRADPHKGLEYLVRAQSRITRQVPYAHILIAAHGEDLERCRRMVRDNSNFEIHEGFVPGDMMADFFQRASLVVLPYVSASTSGVLMTAYSFGKPVVATKVGCLPEYVEDNITGVLVDPADVEQLAEAIIHLLTNDAQRHRMGENARQWVEAKNREVAGQTIRVYEKAIAIHGASKTRVLSSSRSGDSKAGL